MRTGISVPEDVAVVGTENEEALCAFATPTLRSVRFDGFQVGYQAVGILVAMIAGKLAPSKTLVSPPGIEARESTNEIVIDDGMVRNAIHITREQACSGINVQDLCRTLRVSRSTLERRMRRFLNRTPKEELLRVRFKEVKRLLAETDFTIERISG